MKKLTAVLLSLLMALCAVVPGLAEGAAKDETVYVLATADGEARKVIVSDWLTNPDGAQTLADVSTLAGIENVKGEETFDGTVWVANGKDVYYQGTSEEPLPVELKITYTLDGQTLSAAEIAGKSGRATIRFDYMLTDAARVESANARYIPFVVVTGALLDNDVFTNVEVSNGYLVNDGDHTIVAGAALPGMNENLDIDPEDVEFPSYIEIAADVENFALPLTLSLATNEAFSLADADEIDVMDDLNDTVAKLSDAMTQLEDGASQLQDGTGELLDGANALTDGADALQAGLATLQESSGELTDGVNALTDGLATLSGNSAALTEGSAQVFDSLLAVANSQLAAAGQDVVLTIDNYSETLDALLAQTDVEAAAREKVEAAVLAREDEVRAAVTKAVEAEVAEQVNAAVEAQVTEQVLAALNMTPEAYQAALEAGQVTDEVKAQIEGAVKAHLASDEVKALAAQHLQAQMESADVTAIIDANTQQQLDALIEQNMASDDVRKQIAAASEQAQAARESLTALKTQLDSYNAFFTGLAAYTQGVDSAASGASALGEGVPALVSGVTELHEGAKSLADGAAQLRDGVQSLYDGTTELLDGLNEFDAEGVAKLADAVNGDLNGLVERAKDMLNASKSYSNYSGLAENVEGSVRFIWRTDAIEGTK